mmetsp:Transcript_11124/g.39148  ORF Transcript_11124/g.39148 Transcript_11124/m.39148 type:complete len:281 (+) Transcript_11124:1285-2127(+)
MPLWPRQPRPRQKRSSVAGFCAKPRALQPRLSTAAASAAFVERRSRPRNRPLRWRRRRRSWRCRRRQMATRRSAPATARSAATARTAATAATAVHRLHPIAQLTKHRLKHPRGRAARASTARAGASASASASASRRRRRYPACKVRPPATPPPTFSDAAPGRRRSVKAWASRRPTAAPASAGLAFFGLLGFAACAAAFRKILRGHRQAPSSAAAPGRRAPGRGWHRLRLRSVTRAGRATGSRRAFPRGGRTPRPALSRVVAATAAATAPGAAFPPAWRRS